MAILSHSGHIEKHINANVMSTPTTSSMASFLVGFGVFHE